jgi:hypothetical protein
MKPRGVPITVMVLRKMKENDERMEKLELRIIKDQKKISELIPLSAAGSGMMIGTQQLHNLLHEISDVIRQELSNKEKHTKTTSDSGNLSSRHKESLKLGHGGKSGKSCAIIIRNQIDVRRL